MGFIVLLNAMLVSWVAPLFLFDKRRKKNRIYCQMHYASLPGICLVCTRPCTLPTAPVSRSFGLRSSYESISLTPTTCNVNKFFDGGSQNWLKKWLSPPQAIRRGIICPNPSIAAEAVQSRPPSPVHLVHRTSTTSLIAYFV